MIILLLQLIALFLIGCFVFGIIVAVFQAFTAPDWPEPDHDFDKPKRNY